MAKLACVGYSVTIFYKLPLILILGFTVGESSQLAIPLPSYSAIYNENGIYAKYTMDGYYFPDKLEVFDKIPIKIKVYVSMGPFKSYITQDGSGRRITKKNDNK